jgi:hypothetical protein
MVSASVSTRRSGGRSPRLHLLHQIAEIERFVAEKAGQPVLLRGQRLRAQGHSRAQRVKLNLHTHDRLDDAVVELAGDPRALVGERSSSGPDGAGPHYQ